MLGRPVSGWAADHRMMCRLGCGGRGCLVTSGVACREVTAGLFGGVRRGEVRQERPQRRRQRFVRRGHVRPDRVASDIRHHDRVEHRAERRTLLEGQVAVPHIGASAVLGIERQDLRMAFDARLDRMRRCEVTERDAKLACDVGSSDCFLNNSTLCSRSAPRMPTIAASSSGDDKSTPLTSAPRTVVSGAAAMSGIPRRYAVAWFVGSGDADRA